MKARLQTGDSARRAFTLVETMIASGVSLIVLVAVTSSFIAAQRMLHTAMSETEQSLSERAARERTPQFTTRHVLY